MPRNLKKKSKFLRLVLRHEPDRIGLRLDPSGWADVDELLRCARSHGVELTEVIIHAIIRTSEKKRFSLSDDGRRIRADYGHSRPVNLGLEPKAPSPVLYHGTATRFVGSIMAHGIQRGGRRYVHLSIDAATAARVGSRHGKPVVLEIDAAAMHEGGWVFYPAEAGIWLVSSVPPHFINAMDIAEPDGADAWPQ
jgi:putative RNA 2'-phosphotransferase